MASEFVSDSLIATATANDTSRLIDVIDADPKVSMLGMVVEPWTQPVHMGDVSRARARCKTRGRNLHPRTIGRTSKLPTHQC